MDANPVMDVKASRPLPLSPGQRALADIVGGARVAHLWGRLGWQDILRGYRRSALGPFWITISMGLLVAVLGTLYGSLLNIEAAVYIPYMALGFIIWAFISSVITDGCSAFTNASAIITQASFPLSTHVYRVVWRNLIILFHNALIFVAVAFIFSIWPSWTGLLAVPGLLLACFNGVWVALLLGLVSARYRDIPPIITSITRIAFFVTPIIWMPTPALVSKRAVMLQINPFYHSLELIRSPLLGQTPALDSWLVVVGLAFVGGTVTFLLLRHLRWRIAYWV